MMSKKLSIFKTGLISLFLIPVISASLFLVCSDFKEAEHGYTPGEFVASVNARLHKVEPILSRKEGNYFFTSDIAAFNQPYRYDENKRLYTGTQRFFDHQNNTLSWLYEYEDGRIIRFTYLNEDIINRMNAVHVYQTVVEDKLIQIGYHRNDSLAFRRIITKEDARTYSPDNKLIAHLYKELVDDIPIIHFKKWHLNGQLSYTSFPDSADRGTVLTLYDEEGNILKQELTKYGRLVEKIK